MLFSHYSFFSSGFEASVCPFSTDFASNTGGIGAVPTSGAVPVSRTVSAAEATGISDTVAVVINSSTKKHFLLTCNIFLLQKDKAKSRYFIHTI